MKKLKYFAAGALALGAGLVLASGKKKHGLTHEVVASDYNKGYGKVLIAYYSYTGNTLDVAEKLQKLTGGDLYAIQTQQGYRGTPLLYLTSKKALLEENYPSLQSPLPDLSSYDLIFLGGPVWWFTAPPAIISFLQQANYGGKTIVPFCTHGGNVGRFFEAVAEQAYGGEIKEGFTLEKPLEQDERAVENQIKAYLATLEK